MVATKAMLDLQPGIVKVGSPYSLSGRYVDGNHVRFVAGRPQKEGGWVHLIADELLGVCRSLAPHNSSDPTGDFPKHAIIAGTHQRLYRFTYDGEFDNITPIRLAASPANALSTTNGLSIVTVTHATHGLAVGEVIEVLASITVGGITLLGPYTVATVPTANTYTIVAATVATSTAGPTGSPSLRYYITPGAVEAEGDAFGYPPRVWWLESYGDILLALPTNGRLYEYNPDTAPTATVVANSPVGEAMFLTDERYPVILAIDGFPMKMMWPDQEDITVWTPSALNTANERTLKEGTRLMAGAVLAPRLSIVWTDTATYAMQYTGDTFVYSTAVMATNTGLIGPKAFAVNDGVAYWMSQHGFHFTSGSGVSDIPNQQEVLQWVMAALDADHQLKTACFYNPVFNEVSWFLVRDGETEPDLKVTVNVDTFAWWTSTLARTAWMFDAYHQGPDVIAAGSDGRLYRHETGFDDIEALPLPDGAIGQGIKLPAAATPFAFTGNGTTPAFDLGTTIVDFDCILWFEDGIFQKPGTDFSTSGQIVTRIGAPANGAAIFGLLLPTTPTPFTFAGDGAVVTFDLGVTITDAGRVLWFEDGIYQHPVLDFTVAGSIVTRTTAPSAGAVIYVVLLPTTGDPFAFVGDGIATSFDLGLGSIASANQVLYFEEGIYQHPGEHFVVDGAFLQLQAPNAVEAFVKSAPFDLSNGNVLVDVFGYVPDFEAIAGLLQVDIETYDYPNDTDVLDEASESFRQGDGMIDLHVSGRQIAVTITSNEAAGNFRLGRQRVEMASGGSRR